MTHSPKCIAVLGLGYVGLPLALHLSKHYTVIGIDKHTEKIAELQRGYDRMREASDAELAAAHVQYTSDPTRMREADIIIAAVPTPVDAHNVPDMSLVHGAAKVIGENLKRGAIVVFESTVYPGATEDECAPIIAKSSGFEYNKEFFLGYSPERINPGDRERTIDRVIKIVSGSTPQVAQTLKEVYGSIVHAGIHVAPSIRVAEAAKVIENIQRDLNIALVNELAVLFDRLGLNVHDVLAAAGTKWNFHKYEPGLVGGHCIGVDPYYLTYKAVEVGYNPEIILAGRRINDGMHSHYVQKIIKGLNATGVPTNRARVVVLGLTFKANCSDYRNSRATQLISELKSFGAHVMGIDPWLDAQTIRRFGCEPAAFADLATLQADAVIITVPHKEFAHIQADVAPVIVDIKGRLTSANASLHVAPTHALDH